MNKKRIILISSIVSLGGFIFGFDASVISGVIGFVGRQYGLNELQQGWVVSAPSFAAMFAMLAAGILSDRFGRKTILQWCAILYVISAVLSALATGYEFLVVARIIGGLAFGAALILAPMYIGEIAPAEIRGRLVAIQQLNIVLGFSISYFSNYFILGQMSELGPINELTAWRYMLGVEALPALIYFFVLVLVPKSPRWLLYKGFEEQAERVLIKLFGTEKGIQEKKQIINSIEESKNQPKEGMKFLFKPEYKLIIIIGFTMAVVQQITGINAVFFYATTIFEQSGIGTNAAFSQAVLVGLTNLLFTFVAIAFIDKLGRKPLVIVGLIGIIISMSITSFTFSQATYQLKTETVERLPGSLEINDLKNIIGREYSDDLAFKNEIRKAIGDDAYIVHGTALVTESTSMNSMLVLAGILLFVASFACSLGPVMWVLFSEIFPARIRGVALAIFGLTGSLTSSLVQLLFPWELANLGNTFSYLSYAMFGVVGLIVVLKFVPETKGKSLEELERLLIIGRSK